MTLAELKERMGDILDMDPTKIDGDTSRKTNGNWDSLASLEITSMLEEKVNGELTEDEVMTLDSFTAVVDFARNRGILDE